MYLCKFGQNPSTEYRNEATQTPKGAPPICPLSIWLGGHNFLTEANTMNIFRMILKKYRLLQSVLAGKGAKGNCSELREKSPKNVLGVATLQHV